MADKSVGELIAAQSVTPTDLFVLEQNGTAKKLTGQVLENWLVSFADGHGGIQSIEKIGTDVLFDTYQITMSDTTTFEFVVNNGKGITEISKTSTSGLVDTYTITYNDGTTSSYTVTNGAKGDKGDNAYVWIKYASQKPTAVSHSFGDVPDEWIGIYFGNLSEAPTDWQQYNWCKWKGEQGNTGAPATLVSAEVRYQVGDSGTIIPSGAWLENVPTVAQGKYLWTRIVQTFNTGDPVTSYTVSRMGIDGLGSVVSVAGVSPDPYGNVPLTADAVKALSISGGTMAGAINMNGHGLNGLNAPTESDGAANKGYVDKTRPVSQGGTGKNSVTAGSFLVGNGAQAMEEKTPEEVLDLIGAGVQRKTLWNGSWESGSIDVPGLSKYYLFRIGFEGQGTAVLAVKSSNYLRGIGGYSSATPTITTYHFASTFEGDTLNFVAANAITHNDGSSHGTMENMTITSIVGLC